MPESGRLARLLCALGVLEDTRRRYPDEPRVYDYLGFLHYSKDELDSRFAREVFVALFVLVRVLPVVDVLAAFLEVAPVMLLAAVFDALPREAVAEAAAEVVEPSPATLRRRSPAAARRGRYRRTPRRKAGRTAG